MNLPLYPEFKPVVAEDRPIIEDYLRRFPSSVCEMNFPNILIWKDSERPRWTILNGNLCLLVEPTFEPAYFLPPAGGSEIGKTLEACLSLAPRLSRVPEDFVLAHGAAFRVEEDRNNFDYVYLREDLAELKGKKYDGKRNRIKKFEATPGHAYDGLLPAYRDDCRRLLLQWFEEKGNGDPYMKAEKEAVLYALAHFDELGLKGAVVTVGGRVEAFTIGTPLTGDTAVIQIEIASATFPGLAQWINREFVRRSFSACRFINREQDLGVPGLRKAKLSYEPDHLVKKYNLYKK